MLKDCVATLNIGSSELSLTVGERSVNGVFSFRAVERVNYFSYDKGVFEDVKELERKISKLFTDLITSSDISKISTVYVGVPGEFSKTISKNYKISFGKPKKVTLSDVSYLYENAYAEEDAEFELINRSAVYFIVDNYKTHNPIGRVATSLSARVFYGHAINYFIEIIGGILSRVGVDNVKYIMQDYANSIYLFSLEERDNCKLLIDVGYSTTSVSIVCGNGLLFSKAFALGGGMISGYLAEELSCDFEVAEAITKKLNLGLVDRPGAVYAVQDNAFGEHSYSRTTCNNIAKKVLDEICENLDKAVSSCTLKVPSDIEIAFTGEGICNVKGAVEYVSTRLGVFPKTVAPKVPLYDKPKHTSQLALLDTALSLVSDKLFFTK